MCIGPGVEFSMVLKGKKSLPWESFQIASSLSDLDEDDINTKYFYNSETG